MLAKILTIVGARPQFVKAAVLSRLNKRLDYFEEVLVHTGQHFDKNMSDVFFEELAIPRPNFNLGIHGGFHGEMTGRMLQAIENVLLKEKPDITVVFGDTNSTLAGALASAKLKIPVAHIEAGLRSFNRRMPEELNRVLTDHASDLLFCPTEVANRNLIREGIPAERIHQVGDVMYDAALFYSDLAREPGWFREIGMNSQEFYLATLHRAENTDDADRLARILSALAQVIKPVLLPLHPRTRDRMEKYSISTAENVFLVDPVSYLEMAWLQANCIAIATDSGGVQKEAYFNGKHCVVLRDETEWIELVNVGAATLVGSEEEKIKKALMTDRKRYAESTDLFGDGNAGRRILDAISNNLRLS